MELLIFIYGLLMGSFYNVVGLRLPGKESIIKPGSHCPNCKHNLNWYELVPVISYIFLKGRCLECKEKISNMYPMMELLTGLLFLFSYLLFGISEGFYISLIVSSVVVLVFITDSKYMIILDEVLVVSGCLIFIVKFIFSGYQAALLTLLFGFILFMIVYFMMLIGNFILKKESLGGGDIKLSFIAGMILGPYMGLVYLILASFLAFPYAIYILIKNKDNVLPFGPFLASSMLITFYNYDLILYFLKNLIGII